jgi:hypothetical protein
MLIDVLWHERMMLSDVEIRELHYGLGHRSTHRAVFAMRNDEVIVYTVRHLAQRDLTPDDFKR